MDFTIPAEIQRKLEELDAFIEREIAPARARSTRSTSTTAASSPAPTGRTAACRGARGRSCSARCAGAPTRPGTCATGCPRSSAAQDGSNLAMAVIREHLARKGLGLHNDLQNESSIVGNFPTVIMMLALRDRRRRRRSSCPA